METKRHGEDRGDIRDSRVEELSGGGKELKRTVFENGIVPNALYADLIFLKFPSENVRWLR